MKTLTELREALGEIKAKLDATEKMLTDNNIKDDVREQKKEEFKSMLAEAKDLRASIKMLEEKNDLDDYVDQPQPTKGKIEVVSTPEDRSCQTIGEYFRNIITASLPDNGGTGVGENSLSRSQAIKNLRAIAERENRASGLNESVPSDGGFLVAKDHSNTLIEKLHNSSELLQRVSKMSISSNANGIKIPGVDESSRADGSRWGGIRAYWPDEAAEITSSKPKFNQIELNLNKLGGLVYLTEEMMADSSIMESFVSDKFVQEFQFKLQDAIMNGDGAGKPLGFLHANNPSKVTVAKEGSQTATTINYQNVIKMYSRMIPSSLGNAVWLANINIFPQLAQLSLSVGTGGSALWVPAGGASGQPYQTLMGLPIIYVEQAATLGSEGDLSLVDLSQYVFVDKGGIKTASSMHVKFIYDEMALRFTWRVDGQPMWTSTLTPFKGSGTLSPFVTLAVRA